MTVLDIGGGFPGVVSEHGISFATMATTLRAALDAHFLPSRGVRIIAEPGRFFAAATHMAVCVIGKKIAERAAAADGEGGEGGEATLGRGRRGGASTTL